MTGRGPIHYLDQMQRAASEACLFVRGMERASFLADDRTQYAVAYSLCVIGASAAQLLHEYPEFGPDHPDLHWNEMKTMSERLLSDGVTANVEDVWATVGHAIPELLTQLESIRRWRAEGE
ncbi:HepT-like ribonuclease domain-containing protein [Rhizobium mayense]|uniref:DUF86 domain-containing protein n=1 Tax=Rhizobium mayense TaxID=1312184 RepID=A0ABT7JVT3_9HYPH|nr:HepT-like ribonuclease domain-containing protein [Rhizobium mayense]MDL2400447.1 DUF86 domain-containing protein [Rhizobium mayense]